MNAERVPFEALKERSRICFGGFRPLKHVEGPRAFARWAPLLQSRKKPEDEDFLSCQRKRWRWIIDFFRRILNLTETTNMVFDQRVHFEIAYILFEYMKIIS